MLKIGVLEIDNLILWGEQADIIRTALNQYISLQQQLQVMQQGVSTESLQVVLPLVGQLTEIQAKYNDLKDLPEKTPEQVKQIQQLDSEAVALTAKINTAAPEVLGRSSGLTKDQQDKLSQVNQERLTLRNNILKDIAENTRPALNFERIQNDLTARQKEQLILETIREPENNLDQAFLTQMEMLNPRLTSPALPSLESSPIS